MFGIEIAVLLKHDYILKTDIKRLWLYDQTKNLVELRVTSFKKT